MANGFSIHDVNKLVGTVMAEKLSSRNYCGKVTITLNCGEGEIKKVLVNEERSFHSPASI